MSAKEVGSICIWWEGGMLGRSNHISLLQARALNTCGVPNLRPELEDPFAAFRAIAGSFSRVRLN